MESLLRLLHSPKYCPALLLLKLALPGLHVWRQQVGVVLPEQTSSRQKKLTFIAALVGSLKLRFSPSMLTRTSGIDRQGLGFLRAMVLDGVFGPGIGGELVLIKDNLAASGAFVLHALLKKLLVQSEHNVKVAVVALNAPFSHYARVAKKQGLNLMQFKEKGSLVFVDLFSDPNTWKYSISQEAAAGHENPLLPLYKFLCKAMKSEDKVGYIMFDDISLLEVIARGSQDHLLDFVHYCRAIPSGNGQPKRCSLVILAHEDVYTEDDSRSSSVFLTQLEHSSTVVVRIEPLSSGQAADVHGQISVCYKYPISSERDAQVDVVKQQFRLSETSVSFFTPGERVKV